MIRVQPFAFFRYFCIFLIDRLYELLVLSEYQMEDAMTTKFQFVIVHRLSTDAYAIMPNVYKSWNDAEADCQRYEAVETNAEHTYHVAQVSSRLRVSTKRA